jgi:cytoskeletal protein RodZ
MKGGNIFIGMDPKSILIIFVVLAIFYVIYIIGKFIYSLFSQQKCTNTSTENFKLGSTKLIQKTTAPVTVTQAPTTQAPTTKAPVTPTTKAPVTPTTKAPVTPTTKAPVTPAPVTQAPVTQAPTPNLKYCANPLNNCNSCKCKINPLSFDSNNIGCITNNCTCNPNASYCK